MDIAGIGASPTRLLEALEKLGVSQGAELRSPGGPSGTPDADLVRAFLEALEGPGAGSGESPGEGLGEGLGGDAATGGQPFAEGGAEQGGQAFQAGQSAVPVAEGPAGLADTDATGRLDGDAAAIRPVDDPSRAAAPDGTRGVPERVEGVHDAPSAEAGGLRDGTGQVERAGRAEQAGQIEQAVRAGTSGPDAARGADAPATPDAQLREVGQLLERVAGGQATPAELYRLQYMVGMLRVQASSGVQVSQQGSQGMEALLRQQG